MKNVSNYTLWWFYYLVSNKNEDDKSYDKEIHSDLLLFADMYDIKPLARLCSRYLEDHLTKKNVLEVLKVSDMTGHDKLFYKAMEYFLETKEKNTKKRNRKKTGNKSKEY